MNNDYAYIAEVLDRSGSMHDSAAQVTAGHNEFLAGQKAIKGNADFLFAQFDTERRAAAWLCAWPGCRVPITQVGSIGVVCVSALRK